jgi:sortase A
MGGAPSGHWSLRVCRWACIVLLLAGGLAVRTVDRPPPQTPAAGAAPLVPTIAPPEPPAVAAPVEAAPSPDPPSPPPHRRLPPAQLPGEVEAEDDRIAGAPPVTGRIEIPKIGVAHTTYEGNTLEQIDWGPSHWPGTPMPGEKGNTVFPGHRTTHTRPFYDIDLLAEGDSVIFTTAAGRFVYRVTHTFVVEPHDVWIVGNTPDPTFTIFACHPKGSAAQRYVVKGRLASAPPPTTQPPTSKPPPTTEPPCLLCLSA